MLTTQASQVLLGQPLNRQFSILIADDEIANLQTILGYLRGAGSQFKMLNAINGKVACKLAEEKLPDLIIMDWEMPEMNGLDAIAYIKSQPQLQDIPIIMATAMSSSENLELAFKTGAIDYINKPIDRVELIARVKSALALSSSYREIQKQKEELAQAQREIIAQKELIESKNNKITSSIRYAKRIQDSMLPQVEEIQKVLPSSFVFFKPKDIVSGDFYWFARLEHKILIAAVDCTGHGVPGAFMSMTGANLLNRIVIGEQKTSPDQILEQLDKEVKNFLNQEYSNAQDGMDMAICVIDLQENILEFAGAKNPLIFCRDGKLNLIKGSKRSIGGRSLNLKPFEKHQIALQNQDTFYMYTDGYQDQFGGPEGKKFMGAQLRELIHEIHHLQMPEQSHRLNDALQGWMHNENSLKTSSGSEQIDDILIIGFRHIQEIQRFTKIDK